MTPFPGLFISIFILLATCSASSFGWNKTYPLPPPNDTSLKNQPSYTKTKHILQRSAHHKRKHHKTLCRHLARPASGFYVYYALPAPACCGSTWTLQKTTCCMQEGVWPNSPYATFKLAPDDFIYSATNDDDKRDWDLYRDVVANEVIDDPTYY